MNNVGIGMYTIVVVNVVLADVTGNLSQSMDEMELGRGQSGEGSGRGGGTRGKGVAVI